MPLFQSDLPARPLLRPALHYTLYPLRLNCMVIRLALRTGRFFLACYALCEADGCFWLQAREDGLDVRA